jgi:hypothetical protein
MNSQEFDDLDVSELNENADFAEDSKAGKAAAPKAKRTAKVPKQKINQDDEKSKAPKNVAGLLFIVIQDMKTKYGIILSSVSNLWV